MWRKRQNTPSWAGDWEEKLRPGRSKSVRRRAAVRKEVEVIRPEDGEQEPEGGPCAVWRLPEQRYSWKWSP